MCDNGDVPGSTTNLGQSKLDTPDFTFVAQTVFTDDLEFGVAGKDVRREFLDVNRDPLMLSGLE